MDKPPSIRGAEPAGARPGTEEYQTLYMSELIKRPVCAGKINQRLGRLTDVVFKVAEPYPQAAGLFLEHGWGKPTEFIPWDRVVKIEDDAIFVQPNDGRPYGPFVDQPGLLLVAEHLMGRTILDMDGRRIEAVNDAHLLCSKGRMLLVHVDTSMNGFLRRWGLKWLIWGKDRFISWKYVQPLSLEDAGTTDAVALSVARKQVRDLPGEDLADALEMLSGREQQAVFGALGSEKAAEVLLEAEPRARRQLVANLRRERMRTILSEMSVPQLAEVLSVLPHDHMTDLLEILPPEEAERIKAIISDRESSAQALMSADYLTFARDARGADVLREIRSGRHEHAGISYVYVVNGDQQTLVGVVDLRDLVLAADEARLGDLMVAPVVSAEQDDTREDLAEMFAKYHFRMVPVVDAQDRLLGVVHYHDIMKGLVTRARV